MEPGLNVVMFELRNPLTTHYIQYTTQWQSRKGLKTSKYFSVRECAESVWIETMIKSFYICRWCRRMFFNKIQLKLSFHPISPSAGGDVNVDDDDSMGRLAALQGNYIGSEPDKIDEFTKRKTHLVLRHFYSWSSCCAAVAWLWNLVCVHNEWLKFIFHHQRKQLTKRGNVTRSRRIADERDEEKNYW